MKTRFKKATSLLGLKLPEIADGIGVKADTFRRALSRESLNDGYLILLEKKYGISKKWMKEGEEPILIDVVDILTNTIEEDSYSILEKIDPEKIVAYLLLKEKMFTSMDSFNALVEKLKASERLKEIANKHKKS
jgi:hypothetical protein